MLFYYLPFIFSALLSLLGGGYRVCYWCLAGFLIFLCAFQESGVTSDHAEYLAYYAGIVSEEFGPFFVEPTFFVMAMMSSLLTGSAILLFLFYATLGICTKFYVMERATPYPWLSIAVYLSYFFLLHEFTQIRVGVAAGLILCAAYFRFAGQRHKSFIALTSAVLFHYSAIIFLPFMLLRDARAQTIFSMYACCCALFALYFLDVSLIKWLVNHELFIEGTRLEFYTHDASGRGESFNIVRAIFHFVLLTPLVFAFRRIQREQPFVAYSVSLHLSGLLILLMLHDTQVLAYRLSDIFNQFIVFSLISYPILYGRFIGSLIVLMISTFQIIYVLHNLKFVYPYASIMMGI